MQTTNAKNVLPLLFFVLILIVGIVIAIQVINMGNGGTYQLDITNIVTPIISTEPLSTGKNDIPINNCDGPSDLTSSESKETYESGSLNVSIEGELRSIIGKYPGLPAELSSAISQKINSGIQQNSSGKQAHTYITQAHSRMIHTFLLEKRQNTSTAFFLVNGKQYSTSITYVTERMAGYSVRVLPCDGGLTQEPSPSKTKPTMTKTSTPMPTWTPYPTPVPPTSVSAKCEGVHFAYLDTSIDAQLSSGFDAVIGYDHDKLNMSSRTITFYLSGQGGKFRNYYKNMGGCTADQKVAYLQTQVMYIEKNINASEGTSNFSFTAPVIVP